MSPGACVIEAGVRGGALPPAFLTVSIRHHFPKLSIDFEAPTPGTTVLFGPSGAGKSTVLAAIAGLLRADAVKVELDGEQLNRQPPERRRIGMVFQDGRLFPHLTVEQNLTYGLRRAPPGYIHLADIINLLGLEALRRRRPATLSGGERQRVAIGRALLSQPRLLLMDEPLASLDAARRDEILPYFARLRDFGIPIVYVTHAIQEMIRLADTVVLLQAGRVVAAGPLTEIAARVDLPLAARDDAGGILTGTITAHDHPRRLTTVTAGHQTYLVPLTAYPENTPVRLHVPAREIILALDAPQAISVNNIIPATVAALAEDPAGHAALVELAVPGGKLLARITLDAASRLGLRPGAPVLALIKAMSVETLPG